MKPLWLIASIVLVSLASTSGAEAADFEQRAPMSPGGDLEVSNVSGSVEIRGWNRSEIQVVADVKSVNDRIEFEIRDGSAFVGVRSERDKKRSDHWHRDQHKDVDFVINVPRSTRVSVNTVSADIDVRDVTGDQRLESVSGDIDLEFKGTEASVRTVSGDVVIAGNGSVERLKVATVSGDVELSGVGGELRMESVSGDLSVSGKKFRRLLGKTVNGDLDFRGELDKGGEIDFGAINGDVDIVLRTLFDIEFTLETFNGTIDEIFGYRASRKSRYAPGRMLRLTEGDGASRIRIDTLNGDISISAEKDGGREPRIKHIPGRYDDVSYDDGGHRGYGYNHPVHNFHIRVYDDGPIEEFTRDDDSGT